MDKNDVISHAKGRERRNEQRSDEQSYGGQEKAFGCYGIEITGEDFCWLTVRGDFHLRFQQSESRINRQFVKGSDVYPRKGGDRMGRM